MRRVVFYWLPIEIAVFFLKETVWETWICVQFSRSVVSWLFATPWTAARQASLSITNSRSLLKLKSLESVIPSNHLILCPPFLLLPSIFPIIKVFSNELSLRIRWPEYVNKWRRDWNVKESQGKSLVHNSSTENDWRLVKTAGLWNVEEGCWLVQ